MCPGRKEKRPMQKEKKTQDRVYSEAEKKRLRHYEMISEEMRQKGYTRHELIIDMRRANLFAIVLLVPLLIIGYGLQYLLHRSVDISEFRFLTVIVLILLFIVVHEGIHGLSWSLFTPNGFRDIEFGIMRPSLTPYCTCLVPLEKGPYIIGAAMPFLLLGVIPMIIGILLNNSNVLLLGIIMADSGAGDLMIIRRLLAYRSTGEDIVYMDHPTEAGGVVFER